MSINVDQLPLKVFNAHGVVHPGDLKSWISLVPISVLSAIVHDVADRTVLLYPGRRSTFGIATSAHGGDAVQTASLAYLLDKSDA